MSGILASHIQRSPCLRLLRANVALAVVALLVGCSAPPASDQQLAEVYRTGMSRTEARALFARAPIGSASRPANGWLSAAEPYALEHFAHAHEQSHSTTVQGCDVYWIPRGFMGMGIYWDYLFFGADDTLIGFHRRFVD